MVDCTHGPRRTKTGRRYKRIRQYCGQNWSSNTVRRILIGVRRDALSHDFWRRQCKHAGSYTVCDDNAYRGREGIGENAYGTSRQNRVGRIWQSQKVWIVSLWLAIPSVQKPSSAHL